MNIPEFVYKIFDPLISPTVSMLFNNSLSEGIFPECYKTAKMIHFFKSGDSNSTVNIIIDLFPCCLSCQKYLINQCVVD